MMEQEALRALDALMSGLKEAGTDGWHNDEYQLVKDFIKANQMQTTACNA